jgi:hypothetical protein
MYTLRLILSFTILLRVTVVSDADLLPLDGTHHGSGRFTPSTMPEYLESFQTVLNDATAEDNPALTTTTGGTGRVFQYVYPGAAETTESASLFSFTRKSFVFQSKFENLTQAQVDFCFLLMEGDNFSFYLDSTYVPGSRAVYREDLGEELGVDRGALTRSSYTFIPGLSLLNRYLLMLNGRQRYESPEMNCTVLALPSVSDKWVRRNLGRELGRQVHSDFPFWTIRARNIFPSGDRICVTPQDDGDFRLIFEHMITHDLGGLLFGPLFDSGVFDQQNQDAYSNEAQVLENILLVEPFE